MKLPADFKDLLRLLDEHCVEYAIVGGYAVARHGQPRFTGDLDILVGTDEANAGRLLKALDGFGFGQLDLEVSDFTQAGCVVQLGVPPLRIDLLTSIDGVDAGDAIRRRICDRDEELSLYFISRDDLIANKSATGRAQDVADLENL